MNCVLCQQAIDPASDDQHTVLDKPVHVVCSVCSFCRRQITGEEPPGSICMTDENNKIQLMHMECYQLSTYAYTTAVDALQFLEFQLFACNLELENLVNTMNDRQVQARQLKEQIEAAKEIRRRIQELKGG